MKTKNICVFGFALYLVFGLLGCSFEPLERAQRKPNTASRLEYLALLKAAGEYIIETDKLEYMITGLLNPASEERNVAATQKIKITGSKKLLTSKQKTSSSSPYARSASGEQESVDIYLFTTENSENGTEGYVLASTDMRIGNILAIVEGGTLEDEGESFTDIIFDGLEGYIEHTISQYDDLNEEEILQTLGQPDLRGVLVTSGSFTTVLGNPSKGLIHHWYPNAALVTVCAWSWTDGYEALVPVLWHQGDPYNYYVTRSRKGGSDDYVTGCGPTAVAQIMAYHGRPLYCALTEVIIPLMNMNVNHYYYNWSAMRVNFPRNTSYFFSGGAQSVAVLLYEIGHKQRANASYTKKTASKGASTSTTQSGIVNAFRKMGYTTPSSFTSYNYNTVRASIGAGRPVPVRGETGSSGHMWVVDGVRNMSYIEWLANGDGWIWDGWDFVHCNPGWGGSGWYLSGIFDFRDENRVHARSTIQYYYQYDIKMLPQVHP